MGATVLSAVYCTDEDVFVEAGADYELLAPAGQTLAYGADGSFDGSTWAGRWALASASVDFSLRGIAAGALCELSMSAGSRPAWWSPRGEVFVVDSDPTGGSLTLRRPSSASQAGEPPSGPSGLSGVTFRARTLYPQVESVSFEMNRLLGIDPDVPLRAPASLKDMRDLRRGCVLCVLKMLYLAALRTDSGDAIKTKFGLIRQQAEDQMARLSVRWSNDDQETRPRFGMRVER